MDEQAIVIQGSVQNAEIIEPKKCTCENCGYVVTVAGSMLFSDKISVMANDASSMSCPKCYGLIRF